MGTMNDRRPPRSGWRPVPAGVVEVTDLVTGDDQPVYRVTCPCGARLLIDDSGPGPCGRCRQWWYRIAAQGDGREVVERAAAPGPDRPTPGPVAT